MKTEKGAIAWAAIDFLCCLLLVVYTLIAPPVKNHSSINTLGYYAVVVDWKSGSPDDVDTYVQDPHDNIVNFITPQAGLMHLEQDDLGTGISNTDISGGKTTEITTNEERVIIQGIIPGEYTVNVQMYAKRAPGPQYVTVKLYRLTGQDTALVSSKVVLYKSGDERTAFRFTLNSSGQMCCVNHLKKELVYATNAALPPTPPLPSRFG